MAFFLRSVKKAFKTLGGIFVFVVVGVLPGPSAMANSDAPSAFQLLQKQMQSDSKQVHLIDWSQKGEYWVFLARFEDKSSEPSLHLLTVKEESGHISLVKDEDVTNEYFGAKILKSKLDWIISKGQGLFLAVQLRYGDSIRNAVNTLKLYALTGRDLEPVTDLKIDNVKFVPNKDDVQKIEGVHLLTFCDLCDRWEESLYTDVFKIPVFFSLEDHKEKCEWAEEKRESASRLFKKLKRKNTKRAFWSARSYSRFLSHLESEFRSLISK